MKQLIVGLGEALWDCLPEGRKLGGAPANFAYHAGQFGHDSLAISAVGNDALGKETLDEFDKKGVKYLMPKVDYQTGTVQVELDSEGIPTYDIKEGVAGIISLSPQKLKLQLRTAVRYALAHLRSAVV